MYNGNIFPLANHWLAIYKGILSRHPGPSMMENVTEHAGCCSLYLVMMWQHTSSVSGIGGERWGVYAPDTYPLVTSLPTPILSSYCLDRGIAVVAREAAATAATAAAVVVSSVC